jgi:hypothetical protein
VTLHSMMIHHSLTRQNRTGGAQSIFDLKVVNSIVGTQGECLWTAEQLWTISNQIMTSIVPVNKKRYIAELLADYLRGAHHFLHQLRFLWNPRKESNDFRPDRRLYDNPCYIHYDICEESELLYSSLHQSNLNPAFDWCPCYSSTFFSHTIFIRTSFVSFTSLLYISWWHLVDRYFGRWD